ncbi:RNA 2',3'-cyclic phosphodiesterase [Pseudomonadota bacterium]|uniref:RNA 2',3'-cyclic phosphodiesterase n=1 Tax=unclassified Shewanella TaxID=196818 RepID=UPI000CA8E79B|nr:MULTISPECIES: RNA 2',3'-cyclic phosphodiesterase [unclassified Shewanella]MDO6618024.1 RNA 2',3'-cyclic phosphodiesterase [Shewanella sp. 6_MG-2023]MDO6679183.1 RNA 2',3'-cyclic phosphodiesterase [Shewanella sp. 4_MG-2023]MDO6776484.1 RNA 2',3'-cyclic phosphodiesterase [Shewanella sp. 3_MG-2023]PMG30724.1 2'-5' RNA ligase [Shewanella sp. 10N.286.52.C2]
MTKNHHKRCFIAIALSESNRTQLSQYQQQLMPHLSIQVSAVKRENLHLTAAFLGKISSDQMLQIDRYITEQHFSAFEQPLQQLAYWPKAKVLCIQGDAEKALAHIAHSLKLMTSHLNLYQTQHEFRPHISLFRAVSEPAALIDKLPALTEAINTKARHLTLYESISSTQGLIYKPLQQWPLQP